MVMMMLMMVLLVCGGNDCTGLFWGDKVTVEWSEMR